MKEIETEELNITAYQRNTIAIVRVDNICMIILNTGVQVNIICPDSRRANLIKDIILYYPTDNDNSGYSFDFKFKIQVK